MMNFCPNCGEELSGMEYFCPNCGEELSDFGSYYSHGGAKNFAADVSDAYEQIAAVNDADAQIDLGCRYFQDEDAELARTKTVEQWTKAAEQGFALGQFMLGCCYGYGIGIERDLVKAAECWMKAAEQGVVKAQTALGVCYHEGEGVEQDNTKAVELWNKAAKQGNKLAKEYLDIELRRKRFSRMNELLDLALFKSRAKAAERGDAGAQAALGDCYFNGEDVERDYAKAVEWWTKAAGQGYVEAQKFLAVAEASKPFIIPDPFHELNSGSLKNILGAISSIRSSCGAEVFSSRNAARLKSALKDFLASSDVERALAAMIVERSALSNLREKNAADAKGNIEIILGVNGFQNDEIETFVENLKNIVA